MQAGVWHSLTGNGSLVLHTVQRAPSQVVRTATGRAPAGQVCIVCVRSENLLVRTGRQACAHMASYETTRNADGVHEVVKERGERPLLIAFTYHMSEGSVYIDMLC
jgi:hypothetical protein